MKTIKILLLKFWLIFFPKQIEKQINEQLVDSITKKNKACEAFLFKVLKWLKDEYNIDSVSDYIPTNIAYQASVEANKKFKEELSTYRLKITTNLRFVKV